MRKHCKSEEKYCNATQIFPIWSYLLQTLIFFDKMKFGGGFMHRFLYSSENLQIEQKFISKTTIDNLHPHNSLNATMIYILKGNITIHISNSIYSVSPGDLILIRPHEPYHFELLDDTPTEIIKISFEPKIFADFDEYGSVTKCLYDRDLGEKNKYSAADLDDLNFIYIFDNLVKKSSVQKFNTISNFFLIMSNIADIFNCNYTKANNNEHPIVDQILKYIDDHLIEKLNIDDICSCFFINRSKLNSLIKNATGLSTWKYITTKRLLRAQTLIDSGHPATKVAEMCAFSDYSNFYRAYVNYFNQPPSSQKTIKKVSPLFETLAYSLECKPFDSKIFELKSKKHKMFHVTSTGKRPNVLQKTAILTKGKTYTASFKLKTISGIFNRSFYFMVNNAQYIVSNEKDFGRVYFEGKFDNQFINITENSEGWSSISYTFKLSDHDNVIIKDGTHKVDVGFYMEKLSSEFYFADFTIYETSDPKKATLFIYPDDTFGVYGWHCDYQIFDTPC